jgi:hypothetical protein
MLVIVVPPAAGQLCWNKVIAVGDKQRSVIIRHLAGVAILFVQ